MKDKLTKTSVATVLIAAILGSLSIINQTSIEELKADDSMIVENKDGKWILYNPTHGTPYLFKPFVFGSEPNPGTAPPTDDNTDNNPTPDPDNGDTDSGTRASSIGKLSKQYLKTEKLGKGLTYVLNTVLTSVENGTLDEKNLPTYVNQAVGIAGVSLGAGKSYKDFVGAVTSAYGDYSSALLKDTVIGLAKEWDVDVSIMSGLVASAKQAVDNGIDAETAAGVLPKTAVETSPKLPLIELFRLIMQILELIKTLDL